MIESLPLAPHLLWLVAGVMLLGGFVKGIAGAGLPLVAISMLGTFIDPRQGVAIVAIPVVLSNIWQSLRSGVMLSAGRRFGGLIIGFVLMTWVGANLLVIMPTAALLGIVGLVAIVFSGLNLMDPNWVLPSRFERTAGPLVGLGSGLLNGLTTVNGPPILMYLLSLGLQKDKLVGSYGLIAFAGAVPLLISYIVVGLMGPSEILLSTMALIPTFAGLLLGEKLRRFIDPHRFRQMLLIVLIVLGANLLRRALT
ncbi:MAG: sulfite exporter TauE/SafE family protein [Gammaproteobacteria bacterium]|nr:sulfite exporter TauE/SafE family protein [Gammaproteobacteria bacterium]